MVWACSINSSLEGVFSTAKSLSHRMFKDPLVCVSPHSVPEKQVDMQMCLGLCRFSRSITEKLGPCFHGSHLRHYAEKSRKENRFGLVRLRAAVGCLQQGRKSQRQRTGQDASGDDGRGGRTGEGVGHRGLRRRSGVRLRHGRGGRWVGGRGRSGRGNVDPRGARRCRGSGH